MAARADETRKGERSLECARRKGRVQCGGIEWSEKSNGADLPRCRGNDRCGEERRGRRGTIRSSVALCTQARSRISYPFRRLSGDTNVILPRRHREETEKARERGMIVVCRRVYTRN